MLSVMVRTWLSLIISLPSVQRWGVGESLPVQTLNSRVGIIMYAMGIPEVSTLIP